MAKKPCKSVISGRIEEVKRVMLVKMIRKKMYIFTYIALSFFACTLMLTGFYGLGQGTVMVLLIVIAITIMFAGFSITEYRHLQTARLIIENQILYICPVRIESRKCKAKNDTCTAENIDVYISCFGILMDSAIIKFNQDKIRLEYVEIGHEYIYLSYGSHAKRQTIKLLHERIDEEKLTDIVDKFIYDTGIIPTIKN